MKKLNNIFFGRISIIISLFLLCGCIYDDPDCPTGVFLRFEYTLNTRYIDLFDEQVNDLTLFFYNEEDKLVFTRDISANQLDQDNRLYLDLDPGNYRVIVWGNLYDTHFSWGSPDSFSTFRLDLLYGEGGEVIDQHDPLFHGTVSFNLQDRERKENTVELIKDTHTIHVIMEDELPVTRNTEKYALITGCNGCYDMENNPIAESTLLQYMPQYTSLDNGTQADFTVLRLFQDDDLELSLGWDGKDGFIKTNPLVAELMKHPEIKTNIDLDRWDDYTLTYRRDSYGAITLIRINDWDVISNPGGI